MSLEFYYHDWKLMLEIVNDEEGVMELGTAFTIVSQKHDQKIQLH